MADKTVTTVYKEPKGSDGAIGESFSVAFGKGTVEVRYTCTQTGGPEQYSGPARVFDSGTEAHKLIMEVLGVLRVLEWGAP